MKYSQPESYRLTQDSIELVEWSLKYQSLDQALRGLDVGAGCGVIGCEWIKKLHNNESSIHFIEKQNIFYPHLKKNTSEMNSEIIEKDWLTIDEHDYLFDIIYTNPPYFFSDESRASSDHVRDMCRRIAEVDLTLWLDKIGECLESRGNFFWVFRNEDFVKKYLEKRGHLWHEVSSLKKKKYSFMFWKKASAEYKD